MNVFELIGPTNSNSFHYQIMFFTAMHITNSPNQFLDVYPLIKYQLLKSNTIQKPFFDKFDKIINKWFKQLLTKKRVVNYFDDDNYMTGLVKITNWIKHLPEYCSRKGPDYYDQFLNIVLKSTDSDLEVLKVMDKVSLGITIMLKLSLDTNVQSIYNWTERVIPILEQREDEIKEVVPRMKSILSEQFKDFNEFTHVYCKKEYSTGKREIIQLFGKSTQ